MTDLEVFPWNPHFETGIPLIDEQHQQLVSLLNLLANHLAYQSDLPTMSSVFSELTDYAAYHFQTEEAIWHQHLPEHNLTLNHTEIHNCFLTEIAKLKIEEQNTPLERVIEDILSFLTHWLVFHILDQDKRMAKIVIGVQSGLPLPEAIAQGNQEMDGVMRLLIESILTMYDNLSLRTLQLAKEIASRKQAEAKQRLAAGVFENTLDAICITDNLFNLIEANPAFYQTTQYEPEEVLGKNLTILKSGLEDAGTAASVKQNLEQQGHWSGKIASRNKSGELIVEWLTLSSVPDEKKALSNYVAVFSNISYFMSSSHA